jgi:ferritin
MAVGQKIHEKLNGQIQKEFFSEYLYLSMASYFQSIDLPGFANYFMVQAQEERDHAVKFFNYVSDTDGRVVLRKIEEPKSDFKSPMEVFQMSLDHEKFISRSIHELFSDAMEEKDFSTTTFLNWFIAEQVEEEATASTLIGKLKLVEGDGRGLLILDNELAQRTYVPLATSEKG